MAEVKVDVTVENLKEALAIMLQQAVQRLGPMPDKYGAPVRKALGSPDEVDKIITGAWVGRCLNQGSWEEQVEAPSPGNPGNRPYKPGFNIG